MALEIVISNENAREYAIKLIRELPLSPVHVVKLLLHSKKRTSAQNKAQWAGMLADFVEQGWLNGRQFGKDVWHYHLKKLFLPDFPIEGETLPDYKKWEEGPDGELIMCGSTTKLTTKGFSNYLGRCYAYGAQELGIRFMIIERGD